MLPYQTQTPQNYPIQSNNPYNLPLRIPQTSFELTQGQKTNILNLINLNEKISYAGMITKLNKDQVRQQRIIVVTDTNLYTVDPNSNFFLNFLLCTPSMSDYRIERKIKIKDIIGITLSVHPSAIQKEFLVHVLGERDYHFCGGSKRERIIQAIANAYFANVQRPFALYCRDEPNLAKFHTTKNDLKQRVDRRPRQRQVLITPDMIRGGLDWIMLKPNTPSTQDPNNQRAYARGVSCPPSISNFQNFPSQGPVHQTRSPNVSPTDLQRFGRNLNGYQQNFCPYQAQSPNQNHSNGSIPFNNSPIQCGRAFENYP